MNNASKFEAEFRSKAVIRGGLLLFRPADAIDVIRRCREQKVRVLGLDGFRVTATSTQPLMEHSVDFSADTRAQSDEENWQLAEDFLRQRGESSDILFEVTIE